MNAHANISEMITVTPNTLKGVLLTCVDIARPLFTWGSPGIGKSDITNSLPTLIADAYDCKPSDVLLLDFRASQWDAVDTRGVPSVIERDGDTVTTWNVPDVFPSAKECAKYLFVIVFFDELNTANQSVQAALYQLFLDRCLGSYKLPDNVRLFAAGNKESDRAITTKMTTALADRFFHAELVVDNDAWRDWAVENNLHTAVIAYNGMVPEHLHLFDPKSPSKSQATPRGWSWVSEALTSMEARGVNGEVMRAMICGKLGTEVGTQFLGFYEIYKNLPDPRGFIKDPNGQDIPDDPSTCYALCGAIAKQANKSNMSNVVTFAQRLGATRGVEYMTLLMYSIDEKLRRTAPFIQWAKDNLDVYLND